MIFKICQADWLRRKIIIKFLLVCFKTLTICKDCSKSRSEYLCWFSFSFIICRFSPVYTVHVMAFGIIFRITDSFRNNFQSHWRLSESRNKIPKRGYLEGFSELLGTKRLLAYFLVCQETKLFVSWLIMVQHENLSVLIHQQTSLPSPEINFKYKIWLDLTVDRTERSWCPASRRSSPTPPKLPGMDIALCLRKKEKNRYGKNQIRIKNYFRSPKSTQCKQQQGKTTGKTIYASD